MSVDLAAFRLVHEYPGGATALAPVLGKAAGTLSHEVSPNFPTAKLGLADAVRLSVYTGNRQVLNAFASEMTCMVVPLSADVPGVDGIGPRTAALAKEFADLMGTMAADLADGHVSGNDLARIERDASELMVAVQDVLATVRGMHQADGAGGDALATPALRRVAG